MFEAYITNTALYPLMGIEVGTTVHFPMTTQELQAALAKIGIDGKRYSEVFQWAAPTRRGAPPAAAASPVLPDGGDGQRAPRGCPDTPAPAPAPRIHKGI